MISRFRKPPLIIVAFLLPSIAGSALFFGAPLFETARRSLTDDVGNRFVGLGNYAAVLTSEAFRLAAGNTAAFMAISVPALLALSLGCALLLRRSSAVTSLVKSILLLPIALPVCAIALLISFAFGPEGWVNGALASIGIDPVDWLGGPAAFGVLIVEYLWKNLGYATVLWLAALATIPERLEGAARLDGASRWQRLTRITLPLLAPTVPVLVLLSVVNAFKIYCEAYLVAGSYPPQSIYLLPHLLNNWFADLSLGKLAAASMLLLAAFALLAFLLVAAWRRNARPL